MIRYDEEVEQDNPFFDGGELDTKADFILKHMKVSGKKVQVLDPDTEGHATCQWKECLSDKLDRNDEKIEEAVKEGSPAGNQQFLSSPSVTSPDKTNSSYHSEDVDSRCHLSNSMCKTTHSSYAYIFDTCDRQLSNTSLTDLLVSYVASKPKYLPKVTPSSRYIRSCENAQLTTRVSSPKLNFVTNAEQNSIQSLDKFETTRPKIILPTQAANHDHCATKRYDSIGEESSHLPATMFTSLCGESDEVYTRNRSSTVPSRSWKDVTSDTNAGYFLDSHKLGSSGRLSSKKVCFASSTNDFNSQSNLSSQNEKCLNMIRGGRRFEAEKEYRSGHFRCETNTDETVISVTVPANLANSYLYTKDTRNSSNPTGSGSYKPIEPLLFNIASLGLNEILRSQSEHFLSKRPKKKKNK